MSLIDSDSLSDIHRYLYVESRDLPNEFEIWHDLSRDVSAKHPEVKDSHSGIGFGIDFKSANRLSFVAQVGHTSDSATEKNMANLRYPAKTWQILSWLVDNPIGAKSLKD